MANNGSEKGSNSVRKRKRSTHDWERANNILKEDRMTNMRILELISQDSMKLLTFDLWWIILGAVLSLGRKVLAEERECLRRENVFKMLKQALETNI